MSLSALELSEVAQELDEALPGATVQKVHATPPTTTFVTLRKPQATWVLCLCALPQRSRASVLEERPTGLSNPGAPSGFQQVLRRELNGARVTGVSAAGLELRLGLERAGKARELVLSLGRALALVDARATVLAAAPASQGVVLRTGSTFVAAEPPAPSTKPSRLRGEGPLARSRAAEALFEGLEEKVAAQAAERSVGQALKRLQRTRAKVEAELARTPEAQKHRELGELLVRNLGRARRGAKALEAQVLGDDGAATTRTIPLDPKRSPKEQAEWHFHQYRRLTRGAELSRARLAELDRERERLQQALETGAPLDEPPRAPAAPREKAQAPALPYREFTALDGTRIYVGKGAAKNDALTFKHALPHYLWLHARGVPGAHVVLALEKQQAASQDALLDAAHLAAHHSDAKGAPRVEVSATLVKHVRKAKGAAAGAVSYSQEKTIAVRIEPQRLTRLAKSER